MQNCADMIKCILNQRNANNIVFCWLVLIEGPGSAKEHQTQGKKEGGGARSKSSSQTCTDTRTTKKGRDNSKTT